jgi:MFS family permease
MFGTYRAAFRAPGSAAFSAACFIMRMPIAIYGLALILLISTQTHHYGFAGVLAGAYIIGGAAGNPFGARLVDRHGQTRVVLPLTALHVGAVIVLVVLASAHTPDWTLLFPAVAVGFCYLPVGSLVRARWSYALADRPELATAYSFESTVDEVIFVVGPLIATVIATQVSAVLAVGLAGGLVAAGALLLARLRSTEPPAHPVGTPRRRSVLHERGMVLVTCVAIAMGAIFASAEVTMIAFCGQRGDQAVSGAVIASFALGSGISGLWYGARTWRRPLLARFRIQALIMAVLPWAFLAAVNVGILAACTFVVGFAIAPTLITTFALTSRIVADSALTEGLSWLSTGINVGYGVAAAAVGRIDDVYGARAGFGVTIGAATILGLLALRVHAMLRDTVTEPAAVPASAA